MDKRSLLAIVLITIIVMGWLFWSSSHVQAPSMEDQLKKKTDTALSQKDITTDETSNDPVKKDDNTVRDKETNDTIVTSSSDSVKAFTKYGKFFTPFASGYDEIITIETELVKAKLSRKGATLVSWELKKYTQWNNYPTQLIWSSDPDKKGELFLAFMTKGANKIDTRDLYFTFRNNGKTNYRVFGNDSISISAILEIEPGQYIEKRFTFFGNKYILNTDITIDGLGDILPSRGYNFCWADGIRYQEKNSVDESSDAHALLSLKGEILEIDASDDEPVEESGTGFVDYAACKTKYFGAAIIPEPLGSFDGTVDLAGKKQLVSNEGIVERYDLSFRVPYDGGKSTNKFQVYIGPLDYEIVSDYGLEKMVYFGWGFIRYIGEYLILPLFMFIHLFIPNFGITIIVFSLMMKILLYPLSIQQMRSAQKMKLLSPEMEKIRTKYADDNTVQQKEIMKLYSEYGINPAGGCLPLLLQMPILFALWSVLRTSIDLRQADFIWWITDLSLPDILVRFPFSFLGIEFLSGLAILMGITMFLQQKLTLTDPRQKAMIYMMPIMFTLIFSNLPSGLNLYYFLFNLFSIVQQVYINKYSKNAPTLEDLKKAPKKEGWIQKKIREAQDMAEHGGKSIPGRAGQSYANKGNIPRKKKK